MNLPVYLVVTGYFPTPDSWRCAFVYDQVKAIQRTGRYRVVVVNCHHHESYTYNGVEVIGIKRFVRFYFMAPKLFDFINYRYLKVALRRHGICTDDLAVVHAHLITVASYAAMLKDENHRIVALTQFHDPDPYGARFATGSRIATFYKSRGLYRHYRGLAERMDACIAISRSVERVARTFPHATVFQEYGPFVMWQKRLCHFRSPQPKNILLLHNGVDTSIFNPLASNRKPLTTSHQNFTIGCIGNFIDWKDQITLIRACGKLEGENIKVVFIGSGPMLSACKQESQRLGVNAEFRDEVLHERLPEFYRSLDLFVLPSYFEGFGCVFTEALACGVPFVTCKGQGVEDVLKDEDKYKWLIEPCDSDDLASKIKAYIKKPCKQRLKSPIAIDELIPPFLDSIEKLRNK